MSLISEAARDDRAAVDKAMSLIKAFGQDAQLGVGVSELARRTALSKSTAFRLLAMLQRNGIVERAGQAYRLSSLLQELGTRAYSPNYDAVRDTLTPYLADLYEATHQTVHLAVLKGSSVVYLNKLYGHQPVRSPSRIGGRAPAYCTAVGKMLLAFDDEATDQVTAEPMHAWTTNTITDGDRLRAELQMVRAVGIAHDDNESVVGLRCVAAPIVGPSGLPIAAMSISGDGRLVTRQFEHILRQVSFAASRAVARALREARAA